MDNARQLQKLFKHMDEPVEPLPELQRTKHQLEPPPEFVQNIQGSSSAANSSAFHIYRKLRRKEYMRQEIIEEEAKEAALQREYEQQRAERERLEAERTAKKRAKRMKLKQRKQGKGEHHEDRDADDQSAGETGDEDKANVNKTVPDKANNARAFPDKESPIPAKRERSEKTDASVLAEREDDKRATGANVDVDEQPAPHMRKNISASVQLSSFDAGAPMSAKEAALVTGSAEVVPSSMATARPKVVRNIRIIEDSEF